MTAIRYVWRSRCGTARTHQALKRVIQERGAAHPRGDRNSNHPYLLTGLAFCGHCHFRLRVNAAPSQRRGKRYLCDARTLGRPGGESCRPAPSFLIHELDAKVENWFLAQYGSGMIMETVYDPGDGIVERIAEIEAARRRLRADREAGLYDADDDAEWFRSRDAEMGRELAPILRIQCLACPTSGVKAHELFRRPYLYAQNPP
jgi:hypothetical protein